MKWFFKKIVSPPEPRDFVRVRQPLRIRHSVPKFTTEHLQAMAQFGSHVERYIKDREPKDLFHMVLNTPYIVRCVFVGTPQCGVNECRGCVNGNSLAIDTGNTHLFIRRREVICSIDLCRTGFLLEQNIHWHGKTNNRSYSCLDVLYIHFEKFYEWPTKSLNIYWV